MEQQTNQLIKECSRCKRVRKLYCKGVCKSCYDYEYIKLNKDKHLIAINKWKEKNPNYFKDYYRMKLQLKMEKSNG